ncbi:MAG: PGF-pre-PGF domain-containing protein [Methanosarcina sp.]
MEFRDFKPYLKCGLLLIFIISLTGNAYADTNQLVYYNWDSDTGDTIVDNSGNGNNGINYGSTTFTLPTGNVVRHFDGKNRIVIPGNEQISFTDPHITCGVFFHYNYSNPTRSTYLVSKGNTLFRININHLTARLEYEVNADGHSISGTSGTRIQPNKDYEAIVTYDGSHAQLYVNGVTDGSGIDYTASALGPAGVTDDWNIGASSSNTSGLDGTLYSFYLYNRTLSSSEILNLYAEDLRSIQNINKPGGIALSWDDSARIYSCYQHLPIFQKYDATCTMNVNNISTRPQALKDELRGLHQAGWEVAAHGYNHPNSVQFVESYGINRWLNQEILPNIREIASYGYPVYSLSYSYSSRNPDTDAAAAPYFRTLRTRAPTLVNGNVNETALAYYSWDDARLLYGIEIDDNSGASLESIENGIDYAIKTGKVLVLYGHTVTPNVSGNYQTSTARLDSILKYTRENGGEFYHLGDLGDSSWVQPSEFVVPAAHFQVSTDRVLAGKNVTFTDYSTNQKSEMLDFGDGSPVNTTANTVHTYTTPGIYTANLTVTNDISSDSMLKTITVVEAIAPVANFTSNNTTGYKPLNVAFTDTSTGLPTAWEWDFGDGTISTIQNPVHEYSKAGTYSVILTAANEIGSNSIQKSNYITVLAQNPPSDKPEEPGNGGSGGSNGGNNGGNGGSNKDGSNSKNGGSGGSGGAAGGSPEPAKNVKVKELSQTYISSSNPVKFEFPKNVTAVVSLNFDSKKTVGKTTAIVEMLKSKSTLTPEAPEGEIYNYVNIWVGKGGYGTEKDVGNAAICFKVEKAWIEDKDIDRASIILNRYRNKEWNALPTSLLTEDEKYLYLTAETPGFSPFAITGSITEEEKVIEILPEPEPEQPEQNGSLKSEVEKPEKSEETNNSQKKDVNMPGFEMIYCFAGLITVYLCKRT